MDPNVHNANLAGFSVEDKYNYLHRLLFVITVCGNNTLRTELFPVL